MRIFILNHLEYFLANQAAMKVLSHEAEVLKNRIWFGSSHDQAGVLSDLCGLARRVEARWRPSVSNADRGAELVRHDELDLHLAQPAGRRDAQAMAQEMGDIFLSGVLNNAKSGKER